MSSAFLDKAFRFPSLFCSKNIYYKAHSTIEELMMHKLADKEFEGVARGENVWEDGYNPRTVVASLISFLFRVLSLFFSLYHLCGCCQVRPALLSCTSASAHCEAPPPHLFRPTRTWIAVDSQMGDCGLLTPGKPGREQSLDSSCRPASVISSQGRWCLATGAPDFVMQ